MAKNEERQSYWERYDMPYVTIDRFQKQLEFTLESGQCRGVMWVIGEAGSGKSKVIRETCRDRGWPLIDVRTAHMSMMSTGLPSPDPNDPTTFRTAMAAWWPKEEGPGIILFEEVNQGMQHALNMCFSMFEDRRQHEHVLPPGWVIVATGNPSTEGYSVSKFESNRAFRRRLMPFYVSTNFGAWRKHAATNRFHEEHDFDGAKDKPCHPHVLSFVAAKPQFLLDEAARDANRTYACPATWQTVSASAYVLEKNNIDLGGDLAQDRFAASIGTTMAEQLCNYIRDNNVLLDPAAVLNGYLTDPKLRKNVKRILNSQAGQQQRVFEVGEAMVTRLFADRPKPKDVAANIAAFMADMPTEQVQNIFNLLNEESERETGGEEYLEQLSDELTQHDDWSENVFSRLTMVYDQGAEAFNDDE